MSIKILSNSTINKISAGEVIERPSSVVKELVENAIDAGADQIEITLECAGKNLIVIKDNGKGMSKDELELAIQRHATSKLDEDDLLNINSFGFRGEALPSIGAISKLRITSRARGSEESYSLSIIGGDVHATKQANSEPGTMIEVRDLFFATPARLKFLRTDRTELSAITQCVKKIALAHPDIAFSLIHDGRSLLNVQKNIQADDENDIAMKIRNRAREIIGKEFVENSAEIDFNRHDELTIIGYTSLPTYNKASADEQHIFINNRPVKDKILNIALKVAYQDYLARDRHPVSVIFLSIDPQKVDVNVHPAKSEVRFHDPNIIRGLVISAIKDALNNSSDRVSNTASTAALSYMQKNKANFNDYNLNEKGSNRQNSFNIPLSRPGRATVRTDYAIANSGSNKTDSFFGKDHSREDNPRPVEQMIKTTPHSFITQEFESEIKDKKNGGGYDQDIKQNLGANPEYNLEYNSKKKFPLGAAKAQLHETYIISQSEDSIIITDQHAAHERIGYEKIKEQIAQDGLIKQRLLIPEIVELSDEMRADMLNDKKDELAKLGLTIEKFGEKSIIVSEIPSLVGDVNVQQLVLDLSDHFASMGEDIALTELIEHVTETYACHYAIRAGRKLNASEMNELLRQMEDTPFSGQCNHGRQTYVELKVKDVEKLFGRR